MEAAATFSAGLRRAADPIWQAQHEHPFVRGVGDGTLPVERFARYVRQDYLFLDRVRPAARARRRARPDLATMRRFAELAQATSATRWTCTARYAAQFGISDEQLEAEPPAPTTRALHRLPAAHRDARRLRRARRRAAAVHVGLRGDRRAAGPRPRPADARYAAWIDDLRRSGVRELAAWCRGLVDRLAADAGEAGRERMRGAFVTCSEHELAFWDVGTAPTGGTGARRPA